MDLISFGVTFLANIIYRTRYTQVRLEVTWPLNPERSGHFPSPWHGVTRYWYWPIILTNCFSLLKKSDLNVSHICWNSGGRKIHFILTCNIVIVNPVMVRVCFFYMSVFTVSYWISKKNTHTHTSWQAWHLGLIIIRLFTTYFDQFMSLVINPLPSCCRGFC